MITRHVDPEVRLAAGRMIEATEDRIRRSGGPAAEAAILRSFEQVEFTRDELEQILAVVLVTAARNLPPF